MLRLDKRLVSKVLLLVLLLTPVLNVKGVEASSRKGSFTIFEHKINYNLDEDLSTVKYGVDDFDMSILDGGVTGAKLNKVYDEYLRISKQVNNSKHKSELKDTYIGLMNNVIAENMKQVGSFRYLAPEAALKYTIYGSLRDNTVYPKDLFGTYYTTYNLGGKLKGFTNPARYAEYEQYFIETVKAIESEVEFKNEKPFVVLVPIVENTNGGGAFVVDGMKGSELYVTCSGDKSRFVHAVSHEIGHIIGTEFAGDSGVKGTSLASLVGLSGRLPSLNMNGAGIEKVFLDMYNGYESLGSFGEYKPIPIKSVEKATNKWTGIYGYGEGKGWGKLPKEHFAESMGVYFTDKITGKNNAIYTEYGKNNEAVSEFLKLRGKAKSKLGFSFDVEELSNTGSSIKFRVKARGGILVDGPVQEHTLAKGKSVDIRYMDVNGNLKTGKIIAKNQGGRLVLTSSPSNLLEGVEGGSTVGTDEGEDVNKEDGKIEEGKDVEDEVKDKEDVEDFVVEPVNLGKYFRANGLDVGEVDGYIQGFTDKTFRPFKTLTRGEFAQMLNNIYRKDILDGLKINKRVDVMKDVKPNNWYYTPVIRMKKLGVLTGYTDDTFRQTREVSRIEFAKILYELAGDGVKEVDTSKVKIKDSVKWGEEYLKVAVAQGWLELDAAGNVNPHGKITRIEVITVLNDILEIGERDNVKIRFNDLVGLSEDVYKNIYKSVIRK